MDGSLVVTVQVCWIFSLARCGTSVTAYAAAAPWGHAVADEVFGPWDRTGPPYHYPPSQESLRRLFQETGEHITPEVVRLATEVFDEIGAETGRVISKHPHTMIEPDEFLASFPEHRYVYLLRNPLLRLNSLYARGWLGSIGPGHDLERFKVVAKRWQASPHRLVFEDLRRDPRGYFAKIWEAFGWEWGEAEMEAALAYQRGHYHESSKKLSQESKPDEVVSEGRFALPEDAVRMYLEDEVVRPLMEDVGWSTDPADYR